MCVTVRFTSCVFPQEYVCLAAMDVNGPTLVARRAGNSPTLSKTKVCRRLFGDVDHDAVKRVLEEGMAVIAKRQADTWNFDFTTDTPLSGRYEWDRVPSGDENVPVAYALSGMTPVSTKTSTDSDTGKCDSARRDTECAQDSIVEKQTSSDKLKIRTSRPTTTSCSKRGRHIPGTPSVIIVILSESLYL